MELIDLAEHPEGGRFKEVFRSPVRVLTEAGVNRSALTHIYFSLETNERIILLPSFPGGAADRTTLMLGGSLSPSFSARPANARTQ